MQDLVQELKGTMEVDLNPARRLLDGGPRVVKAPTLDKAESQDAKSPQVVHANASRSREIA